ncbi:MAG TPA: hypothetical protein QGF58_01750 [Myxococcota bacterium]|nr:hypothetical protein [Myxococcota bacterium]
MRQPRQAAAYAALLALVACETPTPEPAEESPDIVLVLLPGFRADPIGVEDAEAAFLEGLGRAPDHRFRAAYAQSTSSHISGGSLLTGLYPSAIPLCGIPRGSISVPTCSSVPENQRVIPEILALYGYETGAVLSPGARDLHGLAGDRLGDLVLDKPQTRAGQAIWERLGGQVATWWDAARSPRLLIVTAPDLSPEVLSRLQAERDATPEQTHARYNDEAKRLGANIRGLMDAVGPAWWFVTSTQGVSLGEIDGPGPRRRREHLEVVATELVLDRTARVPLLVFEPSPAASTSEVETLVELVDIAPTIAALSGAAPPAGPGVDLFGPLEEPGRAYTEFGDMLVIREGADTLTFRCYRPTSTSLDPALTACLERTLAALATPASVDGRDGKDGQGSLYLNDVDADPFQAVDLAETRPARVTELGTLLKAVRTGPGAPPGGALSEVTLEELKTESGGYW